MSDTASTDTASTDTASTDTASTDTANIHADTVADTVAGTVRYCGRDFTHAELDVVRGLAASLPTRAAIARAVCEVLGWRRIDGSTKAMNARVALNRMAEHKLVVLPAPRNSNGNGRHARYSVPGADQAGQGELWVPEPVIGPLATLTPLRIKVVATRADAACYRELITTHHYLGYTPLAGAQLRYLVDSRAGVLAALSFAASAWKCAARDHHLGWDAATRQARLHLVIGNARFLILPHVVVPNLASTILGAVTRRLRSDWQAAYGYAPVLVETFVQRDRFAGTSYRAANWRHVGATAGRGKLDRHHQHALPVKDVYLYPLHRSYRAILTAPC